jgi:hypothetical protein
MANIAALRDSERTRSRLNSARSGDARELPLYRRSGTQRRFQQRTTSHRQTTGEIAMNAARLLVLSIILAGCGATSPEEPSPSPTTPKRQTATPVPAGSPSPAASASQPEAGGVFVFTPGVMDCPGEPGGLCPSYTVAEAIAEPGQPGSPIIVRGYVLIEPDGTGWYCETLTNSAPPQCAGERLAFDGLDLIGEADLVQHWGVEELEGVRWSDELQLLGEVTP